MATFSVLPLAIGTVRQSMGPPGSLAHALWPDCTLSHLDPQPLDRGEPKRVPERDVRPQDQSVPPQDQSVPLHMRALERASTDDRPVTQSIAIADRIALLIALRVCS